MSQNSKADAIAPVPDQPIQHPITAENLLEIALRSAEIGNGTVIKRALPSKHKRMIGAWCFLDHAGPAHFAAGRGLDVGPHPHIGLQTFTWMISGSVMHHDSLGNVQLIQPKQVNLMTAGHGISHTEVSPEHETEIHAAQLWIALPDPYRDMPPQFQHYAELPTLQHQGAQMTVLVGDFMGQHSPVEVYSPLLGVDIQCDSAVNMNIALNPDFEYAVMALENEAMVAGHVLNADNLLVIETGQTSLNIQSEAGTRLLLIGGEPFASEILLWWNLVGRSHGEIAEARQQWIEHHPRFGEIPSYHGERLIAPELPEHMRPSK